MLQSGTNARSTVKERTKKVRSKCAACNKDLHDQQTVWAASWLYCSQECGRAHNKSFDEQCEEVRTEDIIRSQACNE